MTELSPLAVGSPGAGSVSGTAAGAGISVEALGGTAACVSFGGVGFSEEETAAAWGDVAGDDDGLLGSGGGAGFEGGAG